MDRSGLVEAVRQRTGTDGGLTSEDVGRVVDAVFGTVDAAGAIVSLDAFGSFHHRDGEPGLRPGKALIEFVNGQVG
jgi:DNA-binding protein HU-beta